MARKKKHPEHVNHERWLISYADFITLLFAFFVVMFAVSQVDTKKLGHFTEAFSKAVGLDVFPMSGESVLAGGTQADDSQKDTTSDQAGLIEMNGLRTKLTSMAQEDALKGLQIIAVGNQLVLRLPENVFFDTGDARVKDAATELLKLVSPELNKRDNLEVRVEGHTDNRPVLSGRYKSNWELSTGRAMTVMQVLVDSGFPATRVAIAGYAEFRPIASNSTDEGRKQNRRVDLVVTAISASAPADSAEPAADPETPPADSAAAPVDSASAPIDSASIPAPTAPSATAPTPHAAEPHAAEPHP